MELRITSYTAASGTAYQIKASTYSYRYVDFTKKFIYAGGISGTNYDYTFA